MKTNKLIEEIKEIQESIEGDNFTWENLYYLIEDIKAGKNPDVVAELRRISSQVESDRFTVGNIRYLLNKLAK